MPIEAEHVSKRFKAGTAPVIDDLCLRVEDGEFVALTGRSGSGKTTLLYMLSTLDLPTSGRMLVDGRDVARLSVLDVHRLRNLEIGFIFQFHYLLPELTALENVLLPARKAKRDLELRGRARELLGDFGLGARESHLPGELSGGERQRVAIARALLMRPRYLFADEPTGSLDSFNGNQVMEILKRSNQERGMTILLVTHEPDYARRADRVIRLADGRIVEETRTAA